MIRATACLLIFALPAAAETALERGIDLGPPGASLNVPLVPLDPAGRASWQKPAPKARARAKEKAPLLILEQTGASASAGQSGAWNRLSSYLRASWAAFRASAPPERRSP
jgi:hypothetical protein